MRAGLHPGTERKKKSLAGSSGVSSLLESARIQSDVETQRRGALIQIAATRTATLCFVVYLAFFFSVNNTETRALECEKSFWRTIGISLRIKGRAGTVQFEDADYFSLDGVLFTRKMPIFDFCSFVYIQKSTKSQDFVFSSNLERTTEGQVWFLLLSLVFFPLIIPPRNGGASTLTSDGW